MPRTKTTYGSASDENQYSVTAVNRGAQAGEPMQQLRTGVPDGMSTEYEDLGGPTIDDPNAELVDAGARLRPVRDAVTRNARPADPMQKMAEEEEYENEEMIDEHEEDLYEGSNSGCEEEEGGEEEEEDDEKPSKRGRGRRKNDDDEDSKMNEEYEEDDYYLDLEADVDALVSGEDLSEEFKEKTRVIYEAAVRSKVSEIREQLEEQYEIALQEEVEAIAQDLQDRVDAYLEYVAEEWISDNQLAVEYGIKDQISESFLGKLFNLFEEHHVNLPQEKYDIVENMVEKLDEMENKLNEQIEKNISLTQKLSESVANRIFDEVADGLAITQQEKLASLAESVEFESERSYREKLATLRESYFPQIRRVPVAQLETLSEGVSAPKAMDYSPAMEAYLQAASLVANV